MISLLIADNKPKDIKDIINCISLNTNVKISSIAYNGKDAYKEILEVNPDLVILKFNLPICNTYQFLQDTLNINSNIRFIITYVDNINNCHKLNKFSNVLECIDSTQDITTQLDIINNIIHIIDQKNIENAILHELQYIGYKPSHKGTIFLSEIIKILIDRNNYEDYCLETDLYPIIGKKYNRSVNLIKVDIFKATEAMYYNCDILKLYNYFNVDTKPNLKDIIFTVALNTTKNNIHGGRKNEEKND